MFLFKSFVDKLSSLFFTIFRNITAREKGLQRIIHILLQTLLKYLIFNSYISEQKRAYSRFLEPHWLWIEETLIIIKKRYCCITAMRQIRDKIIHYFIEIQWFNLSGAKKKLDWQELESQGHYNFLTKAYCEQVLEKNL